MITLQELCKDLNNLLKPYLFSDSCPNGLQIEGKKQIKTIVTAVSSNLATIEAAIEAKADALIVHHGMFWNQDSYVITGVKRQKLTLLMNSGISLLAYHLPLDAHQVHGNNWRAAIELGWENLEPFGMYKGVAIGVKGTFSPLSRESFMQQLENYYGHTAYLAPGGNTLVKSAALISGGAYRSLGEAVEAGVDCFITGNFDEPAWHQALEEKINFLALGHSHTEKIGPKSIAKYIEEKFQVHTSFLDIENPF